MQEHGLRVAIIFCLLLIIGGAIVTQSSQQVWEPNFHAPLAAESWLTVDEMKLDLDYLVEKLENVHPLTVKGYNQLQQEHIQACYAKITEPMTAGEFYFIANELICMMQDAHTFLHLNMTEADQVIELPLCWLEGGLYVRQDTGSLQVGDEIISISGMTPHDLLEAFQRIVPAENSQWVRVRATGAIYKQPYLQYLDLIKDGKVNLEIRRGEKVQQVMLPLVSYQTYQEKYLQSDPEWVSYTLYQEDDLAVFKLDKCINNEHYQSVLNSFFEDVAQYKIKHIAIDVRSNLGGDSSVITSFIKYLNVENYRSYGSLIRFSKDAAEQRSQVVKTTGTKTYSSKKVNNSQVSEQHLRFNGNIYVLTSPMTFSSGNWFAVMLQDNQMAQVIGEPSGNAPSSYGDVLAFQLPKSGYRFNVSYKNWLRPDENKHEENAVMPDYLVFSTGEDLIQERDPQIEALLQQLRS